MSMNPSPHLLIKDIRSINGAPRRGIIIATSPTQFLPNQTNSLIKRINRPFYYVIELEFSNVLRKISKSLIRVKELKWISILLGNVRNPSLEDDFDKLCSPDHTAASHRGRTIVKISRDTSKSNLYYIHNTLELHGANQYKWFVYGSDKVKFSKTVKHTFSTFLFFREMSEHTVPIPMEVEEVGMEEYMLDYQRMLDGPDSPSEVQGEGVGDCAGGVLVVREADVMGREGGAEGGDAEPLPESKDSILLCPERRSDDFDSEGVNSTLPSACTSSGR